MVSYTEPTVVGYSVIMEGGETKPVFLFASVPEPNFVNVDRKGYPGSVLFSFRTRRVPEKYRCHSFQFEFQNDFTGFIWFTTCMV
jgi:hypothetical protein